MAPAQIEPAAALTARVQALVERGVVVVDPRQTYVGPEVELERICAGAVLHPGARLCGPRVFVGPGAEVGAQGPATVVDTVLDANARLDGGYARGAVLLRGASAGLGAQLRDGTLLEEEASVAHTVGLKHTILLSFATLGSLVNFCDALMAGGTSRADHSEIGSGFIHFNFTPWGRRGDKATPSLCGDVVSGVFLRSPRIFLGGSAGMVGPRSIGYGSVTGAGQVVRKDVPAGRLVMHDRPSFDVPFRRTRLDQADPRTRANVAYIAQLVALRAWYQQVRLCRVPAGDAAARAPIEAAIETLCLCIDERVERLDAFVEERGATRPALALTPNHPCPLLVSPDEGPADHVDWVRSLDDEAVGLGTRWLQTIVDGVIAT